MNWFERKIRRYEHRRWTTDDNRRVQPFHWGLEHIGGSPNDSNPRAFLREYARDAIEHSADWFAASPATDYRLDRENILSFTSSIESPWPENNTVHAQLFPARKTSGPGPAVLVLPNWNAKWHGQNGLCRPRPPQLERQVARPERPLRLDSAPGNHRPQNEHALS